MMRGPAALALAALLLTGCATQTRATAPDSAPGPAVSAPRWQAIITGPDRRRLARLWEAWTRSLAQIRAAGQDAALAALGPMAVADSATINRDATDVMAPAIAGPLPGTGTYRCRMVKLGQRAIAGAVAADGAVVVDPAVPVVAAGESVPCRIEQRDGMLWFEIAAAGQPQRLGGRLFADGDRMVFLGTAALAGEMGIVPYGADPERDAVGALRAVAADQWRLELPWPAWQANLALVEILPG